MTDLICPFKFMTSSVVKDCIRSKCALWAGRNKSLDYTVSRIDGKKVFIITEEHCALNTSPKTVEATE